MAQFTGKNSGKNSTLTWRDASEQPNGVKINYTQVGGRMTNSMTPNSTQAIRDVRLAARKQRITSRAQQGLHSATRSESRKAFSAFQSAFSDIENGKYSVDRISNDMYDSYDSDIAESFEMPSGDDVANKSSEEILLAGNRGVAQSVMHVGNAQLRGMNQLANQLIGIGTRNSEAMTRAINASITQNINALNNTLYITNSKIDNVSRSIQALIDFQNQNTTKYYETTSNMINGLGKMMENLNKSLAPQARKDHRFDISGGLKGYLDYVVQGFMESFFGAGVGQLKNFVPGLIGGKTGPGGIVGMLMRSFLPQGINKKVEDTYRNAHNLADEILEKLADKLDNIPMFAGMGLGGIFGNRRGKINGVNMSAYSKEALPWNGIAQKTLTEVIPELLTSIESKLDGTEKRYMDYQSGQFMSKSQIEKRYEEEYFDRLAIAMNPAIQRLESALNQSSKNGSEKDRIRKEMQALFDDRFSGKISADASHGQIRTKLTDFGMSRKDIEEIVREVAAGARNGISAINDLNYNIEQTQSVYRNINNRHGQDLVEKMRGKHDAHSVDYRYFSKGGGSDIRRIISDTQSRLGLDSSVDIASDQSLQSQILAILYSEFPPDVTAQQIERAVAQAQLANGGITSSLIPGIGKHIDRFKAAVQRGVEKVNKGRVEAGIDKATSFAHRLVYEDEAQQLMQKAKDKFRQQPPQDENPPVGSGRIRSVHVSNQRTFHPETPLGYGRLRNAASTFFSKHRTGGAYHDPEEDRRLEDLQKIATQDTNRILGHSSTQIDHDDFVQRKAMEEMGRTPEATGLEESIVRANNSVRAAMSIIVGSFKNFGAAIFGKDGIIHRIWDSDTRKKITGKLFTNEDAIFGEQYRKVKDWASDTWSKAKDQLGKGYDYVREQALKYKFGEDYQNNDDFKNSKFWSQWTSRQWHKERRQKAQDERYSETHHDIACYLRDDETGKWHEIIIRGVPVDKDGNYDEIALEERVSKMNYRGIIAGYKDLGRSAPRRKKTENEEAAKAYEAYKSNKERATSVHKAPSSEQIVPRLTSGHQMGEEEYRAKRKAIIAEANKKGLSLENSEYHNQLAELANLYRGKNASTVGGQVNAVNPKKVGELNEIMGNQLMVIDQNMTALSTQIKGAGEAFVGDLDEDPEKKKKSYRKEFTDKLKKHLPKALAAGIVGAGVGLANSMNFSLLGGLMLPGGPVAGAIVGAGLSILSQTEAFKTIMYG